MNTLVDTSEHKIYSPHNTFQKANFSCYARGAKAVHIVGDFNRWIPALMEQRQDGWWLIQIWLAQGQHQYRFLLDGEPVLDLHASGVARDEIGQPVSLIAII